MKIWNKLLAMDIQEKEYFDRLFKEKVKSLQRSMEELRETVNEEEKYYQITEMNIKGGWLIQIVPKEAYSLYKEMRKELPNEFLGFSVLVGKYKGTEVRVSCFGIQCSRLGKSLSKS